MTDDWDDYVPTPPLDEARFDLDYTQYPGGESAYWRDFKAASKTYFHRLGHGDCDSPEAQQYAEEQARYALKARVNDVAQRVADAAEVSHRNFSHWLVKAKGFPWRNDCDFDQLRELLTFLEQSATVEEARQAPNYPDRTSPEAMRAAQDHWDRRLAERKRRT